MINYKKEIAKWKKQQETFTKFITRTLPLIDTANKLERLWGDNAYTCVMEYSKRISLTLQLDEDQSVKSALIFLDEHINTDIFEVKEGTSDGTSFELPYIHKKSGIELIISIDPHQSKTCEVIEFGPVQTSIYRNKKIVCKEV